MIEIAGVMSDRDHMLHSYTDLELTLDALEWCRTFEGNGRFHFNWALEGFDIMGEFYFTDAEDHMMFALKWGK